MLNLHGFVGYFEGMTDMPYEISVTAGTGRGLGHYWTCDLGHEYVRINAAYRT